MPPSVTRLRICLCCKTNRSCPPGDGPALSSTSLRRFLLGGRLGKLLGGRAFPGKPPVGLSILVDRARGLLALEGEAGALSDPCPHREGSAERGAGAPGRRGRAPRGREAAPRPPPDSLCGLRQVLPVAGPECPPSCSRRSGRRPRARDLSAGVDHRGARCDGGPPPASFSPILFPRRRRQPLCGAEEGVLASATTRGPADAPPQASHCDSRRSQKVSLSVQSPVCIPWGLASPRTAEKYPLSSPRKDDKDVVFGRWGEYSDALKYRVWDVNTF